MGPLAGITAAIALIAYVGFSGGLIDLSFPESNAPQAPAVTGNPSSSGQPAALLSFPIPYDATITQSGPGITEPRTRFYVSTSTKEAQ